MLNINNVKDGSNFKVVLEGRLDTTTAPQLEEQLEKEMVGVTNLEFDFTSLEYISSAGLRVLLSAQKLMNKQGSMVVTNVSEEVMEIFEVTGFSDILTIK